MEREFQIGDIVELTIESYYCVRGGEIGEIVYIDNPNSFRVAWGIGCDLWVYSEQVKLVDGPPRIVISDSFRSLLNKMSCPDVVRKIRVASATRINYLHYRRKEGLISFLPIGKEHIINEDGTWDKKGRQECNPGKIFKALGIEATPQEIECFVNSFKAECDDGVVSIEDDIHHVYDEGTYGWTATSCMSGNGPEWFEIYELAGCKMVTLRKEGKLMARALLWHHETGRYMDRIYYCKEEHQTIMKDWAKENGISHKASQNSCSDTLWVRPDGREEHVWLRFPVAVETVGVVPYIDTFCYAVEGWIFNDHREESKGKLQNTCGCGPWQSCGEEDDDEDDNHDGQTYCDVNEQWYDEEDVIYISYTNPLTRQNRCMNVHHEDLVYCEDREYYLEEDTVQVDDHGSYPKWSDDIICIDDEYYHIDDVVYDEHDECDIVQCDSVVLNYRFGDVERTNFTTHENNVSYQKLVDCNVLDDDWDEIMSYKYEEELVEA